MLLAIILWQEIATERTYKNESAQIWVEVDKKRMLFAKPNQTESN